MDAKEFVSLSDSGDRTIIVGEEDGERVFKVYSIAMSMASPVWRAMFNPTSGFLESNPDVPVAFPEDDPDALLILLRIAHLQFEQIPKSIPFKLLIEIATLCDKYDNVVLVQPFIEKWMNPWSQLCLTPGYETWLFIAWTFGCKNIFNLLAASLVLSIEFDSKMRIVNCGKEILVNKMPPGTIEGILKARDETIAKLLELFDEVVKGLIKGTYCVSSNRTRGFREHTISGHRSITSCNVTNLGLFVKVLHHLGLGSQKVPVKEVKTCISKIVLVLKTASDTVKIEEILNNIPLQAGEQWKRYMEEQAKKSGIGNLTVPDQEPKEGCILM